MFQKKYIISIALLATFTLSQLPVFADEISDIKTNISNTISQLVQKYEARIQELEKENTALKQEIISLKGSVNIPTPSQPIIQNNGTNASTINTSSTKTEIFNNIVQLINSQLATILSENHLPGYAAVGLFEFIEPNAFFISLDDGNNPAGVTAFKNKILFTFDNKLQLTKIGMFDLDYNSSRYRTTFGSNPYVNAIRTRIENPNYKGKLLTPTSSTAQSTTPSKPIINNTPTINTPANEVTVAQIKSAYDKTKLLDALKLSESYILKDPNNLDVLRIRYRSYYIIGKYEDSLSEIKKIETLQGSAFERTIACDAAVIGKIAKNTDMSTYYGDICKKK